VTARQQLEIEQLESPVDRLVDQAQINSSAALEVNRSIDRAKKPESTLDMRSTGHSTNMHSSECAQACAYLVDLQSNQLYWQSIVRLIEST